MNLQPKEYDSRALITTPDGRRVIKPIHSKRITFDTRIGLHTIDTLEWELEYRLFQERNVPKVTTQSLLGKIGFQAIYLLHIDEDSMSSVNHRLSFTTQDIDMDSVQDWLTLRPHTIDSGDIEALNLYNATIE